ncbi:sodium bicarbonate cotransporter 3 isoform X2 [Planococcus citri]|uniref:sodium bicarbonate cotransporter 3 isoform X2 n=1 Tax=Planococcus citri TaxID=170843 RepID=UPI0031F7A04D
MDNPTLEDAPRDPRAYQAFRQGYTEQDFEGHRARSVFSGFHVPSNQKRHRRHHRRVHTKNKNDSEDCERAITPPAQRVQFILGEDAENCSHEPHPLFTEMEELVRDETGMEWKETARWIKFEEDVEEGGNRWSKPHVATLSLHALFELRSFILNGTVILDADAHSLEEVTDLMLDNMIGCSVIPFDCKDKIKETLLQRHRHQHERRKDNNMSKLPIIRSLAEIGKSHSSSKMEETHSAPTLVPVQSLGRFLTPAPTDFQSRRSSTWHGRRKTIKGAISTTENEKTGYVGMPRIQSYGDLNPDHKGNTHFMRKIPAGAEASSILVGQVDFLEKPVSAFVRLSEAVFLSDLTEVPIPSRFIFILLGPTGLDYHEVGRSMATLMSDEIFHEVAYKARNRNHLLAAIDEFLDAVTVLPPGEWDPSIRIEPPAAIPQDVRKRHSEKIKEDLDTEVDEQKLREESGLSRTGVLFGGLINDVKRKLPWYKSDFTDALALQCVASWIFLYFACLSPIITFGGLLSDATHKNMAAMESLVSGFVCGIGYGLFSGQPLTILGSTGPVLVFEQIVYDFCADRKWNYLSFRLWIGLWVGCILMILVAADASAFVCYITRFTEENFATLIAFIFIYKAIENVATIGKRYPINSNHRDHTAECLCFPPEDSQYLPDITESVNWTSLDKDACKSWNGTWSGQACDPATYVPDVFLMSIILFFGTFLISVQLKDFKNALFFSSKTRQFISDFAVIIAIFSMSIMDYVVGVKTPKLEVPREFKPTSPTRGWIVPPFNSNPIWTAPIAILPALLGTILIFMDQQITAVIVNRKENKLKKGCGYHLDLFVLSILIIICSVMGIPWFVAATVLSINHVNSLKLESECAAPGEKPQFLGVREQRVTHVLIFTMIGLSVLITPLLRHIPMPVLYGVFLYMGVASLKGLQFFDRILIIFMPAKYQPDHMFLRQVPLKRVHLFTIIQLICLIILWVIKSVKSTSILFPLMLVVMIALRKALDWVFTQRELKILDDIMPETIKRTEEELRLGDAEEKPIDFAPSSGNLQIPLVNGNIMKIPLSSINISEEVNKTGIWKQVNYENGKNDRKNAPSTVTISKTQKKSYYKKDVICEDEKHQLSTMTEEEEDEGLTIKVGTIPPTPPNISPTRH